MQQRILHLESVKVALVPNETCRPALSNSSKAQCGCDVNIRLLLVVARIPNCCISWTFRLNEHRLVGSPARALNPIVRVFARVDTPEAIEADGCNYCRARVVPSLRPVDGDLGFGAVSCHAQPAVNCATTASIATDMK